MNAESLADNNITFTDHPQDNCVYEGEDAYFQCGYTGTRTRPSWLINGMARSSTSLPLRHMLNRTGLIVTNVDTTMNNWTYACFFLSLNITMLQMISSREGRLKVLTSKYEAICYSRSISDS